MKIYKPCIGSATSDYEMRCSTRKYHTLMSEDYAVCNAVVTVWSTAIPGPLQLYRNPPFLQWKPLTSSVNRKPLNEWTDLDL